MLKIPFCFKEWYHNVSYHLCTILIFIQSRDKRLAEFNIYLTSALIFRLLCLEADKEKGKTKKSFHIRSQIALFQHEKSSRSIGDNVDSNKIEHKEKIYKFIRTCFRFIFCLFIGGSLVIFRAFLAGAAALSTFSRAAFKWIFNEIFHTWKACKQKDERVEEAEETKGKQIWIFPLRTIEQAAAKRRVRSELYSIYFRKFNLFETFFSASHFEVRKSRGEEKSGAWTTWRRCGRKNQARVSVCNVSCCQVYA